MRDVPFSSTDLAGQFPFDPGGRSSQGSEQRASKSKVPKPPDQESPSSTSQERPSRSGRSTKDKEPPATPSGTARQTQDEDAKMYSPPHLREGPQQAGAPNRSRHHSMPSSTEAPASSGTDRRAASTRKSVREALAEWREAHTVERVRDHYASNLPSYMVFEQATGGCLDTFAAANAGFQHLGGTEDLSSKLGRLKADIFEYITGAPCVGDARDWRQWSDRYSPGEIDYYKAGMPCTDYASLGYREGALGSKGGDLFLLQAQTIIKLRPKTFRLEMVPTALDVNDGYEVACVINGLSRYYNIDADVVRCWEHGDPTSRSRLIICGLCTDIFADLEFEWPAPICDTSWYPTARDIAVPDTEVPGSSDPSEVPDSSGLTLGRQTADSVAPGSYWRHDSPRVYSDITTPSAGYLQRIGYAGTEKQEAKGDAGFSRWPFNIQGWDSVWATQMATNGGSRRPKLSWKPGEPIGPTRMTTVVESCRIASLDPDSYLRLAKRFYLKELGMTFDQWVRELVNLGVPLMTGTAIDQKMRQMLERAKVPPTDHVVRCMKPGHTQGVSAYLAASKGSEAEQDRDDGLFDPMDVSYVAMSAQIDTNQTGEDEVEMGIADSGATDHLHDSSVNPHLRDARPSKQSYQTAGGGSIAGDLEGELDVTILNLDRQPEFSDLTDQTYTTTTVKGLGHSSLFSLDASFRDQGYDIFLRHGYKKGDFTGMHRPAGTEHGPESYVPFVFDWQGQGGWRVPYVVKRPGVEESQHIAMLQAILEQNQRDKSRMAKSAAAIHTYTAHQAKQLERRYWACSAVTQTVAVRVPGERDIRPAFRYGGLRRHKSKKWHEFHGALAHMGEPNEPCAVCEMYKGASRAMPRHTHGKPTEKRPGFCWHLDMIVFRERSEEGCKYLLVLTDECTQAVQLLPLYWKSDAVYEIRRWILALRAHPAYVDIDYQIIGRIVTDNEGVWNEDATDFQNMLDEVKGCEMIYGDSQDHARDNARAEGKNKIIEAGIQSILYDKNLPPSWWQRCAADVMHLANRLPLYADHAKACASPDQDQPAPITKLFHGYISQNQVYRELDNYIAVGTPALCHLRKVKGSDLEPRVRWGIAIGTRGKITKWLDPFTNARFRTRSVTAFTLQSGMNWSQFLGLGDIAPSAQSRMLPQDEDVKWTIELPAVRANAVKAPPPVREITAQLDDTVAHADMIPAASNTPDREIFEYFPRIRQRQAVPLGGATMVEADDEEKDEEEEAEDEPDPKLVIEDGEGNPVEISVDALPLDVERDDDDDAIPIDGFPVCDPDRPDAPLPPDAKPRRSRKSRKKPRTRRRKGSKQQGTSRSRPRADERKRLRDMMEECEVDLSVETIDPDHSQLMEEQEAQLMRGYAVVTDGHMNFARVCKQVHSHFHSLPFELHQTYRLWLLTKPERGDEARYFAEDLPRELCESKTPLPADLTLPYPSGPHWNRLCDDAKYRKLQVSRIQLEDCEEEQQYQAMRAYYSAIRDTEVPPLALMCRALVSEQCSLDEVSDLLDSIAMVGHLPEANDVPDLITRVAYKAQKKRRKTVAESGDPAPSNMIEALLSDRAEDWVSSIYKEFDGLVDQGVFSHNWTRNDLAKAGIVGKPVPCSTALTHKYKDGVLEKLKTRICIAGHRGNVTKGIHYTDVFSPSPVQHTERLLQAMMVNFHLERFTMDVKMAYTNAPLPPGERIAVVYPDGFKRRHPETGEELFLVLEKNLYGMPSAARGWGQHRDQFILKRFNEAGWRVTRSLMDPCLFVIDKLPAGYTGAPRAAKHEDAVEAGLQLESTIEDVTELEQSGIERTWMLIHTDDCDCYGTNLDVVKEINDIMNQKWTTEVVDSSYVLGVKRTLVRDDPDGWHVTLTMTSFIDDLVTLYQSDLDAQFGRRTVSIPFPEGVILSKANEPAEGEVERNIKKGYQRLVGSLLWCVRHCFPICAYGCSQLCKLMATPTDDAWRCALHMLMYLHQNRRRGIRFCEGDGEPVAFVDASNRDDPHDGRTQYGYSIHWGGPLIVKSGKLNHVGINSTYNEYMALTHCIKQVWWLRQLMTEIGLASRVSSPTDVHADNKQANTLCSEDLVTAGNMYFRTHYHYNKEAVRDGYVCIHYIHTASNISDACTKALAANKIRAFEPILHGYLPLIIE